MKRIIFTIIAMLIFLGAFWKSAADSYYVVSAGRFSKSTETEWLSNQKFAKDFYVQRKGKFNNKEVSPEKPLIVYTVKDLKGNEVKMIRAID